MTWWKPKPVPWSRLEGLLRVMAEDFDHQRKEQRAGVRELLERIGAVMATVEEFKEALTEQNDAILAEVQQINDKLAQAGNIPADVLASLKANTQAIRDIVQEPLPEPEPEPNPNPERGRR